MANTAQLVRQRIQDFPQAYDDTYYGDGTAVRYKLPNANITSGTAYVAPAGNAWVQTGATFNVSGSVLFANVISAQTAFRVEYVASVWSDDTIGEYITAGGGVVGAALQCAYDLLFDNVKRNQWMAANGAQFSNVQAGNYVKDIISALKDELKEEAVFGGSMASWAENQGDY